MKQRLVLLFTILAVFGFSPSLKAARAIVVSVPEQRLALVEDGVTIASYPISTSRFGLGDETGSYRTPLGCLEIASRIGAEAPVGAVFKNRVRTGEILRPNAAGRDPIVTRILWLRGLEPQNARAYGRGIYIHGTPVESLIGRPASYGCIRMRSRDIVQLFDAVPVGTRIVIVNSSVAQVLKSAREATAVAHATISGSGVKAAASVRTSRP
jgi:lipoprotein-anchoring transpeptidase ErfK/SrfK